MSFVDKFNLNLYNYLLGIHKITNVKIYLIKLINNYISKLITITRLYNARIGCAKSSRIFQTSSVFPMHTCRASQETIMTY